MRLGLSIIVLGVSLIIFGVFLAFLLSLTGFLYWPASLLIAIFGVILSVIGAISISVKLLPNGWLEKFRFTQRKTNTALLANKSFHVDTTEEEIIPMSTKQIDELNSLLSALYRQRLSLENDRKKILNKQERPIVGHEKDEKNLREQISTLDLQITKTLERWAKELQTDPPMLPPPNYISIDANLDLALDVVFFNRSKKRKIGTVPPGQIFVLGHGYDQSGFAEVYLPFDMIENSPHWEDQQISAIVLKEYPGNLQGRATRFLPGISVSEEDLAKASLYLPIYLADPIQTLRRIGNQYLMPENRKELGFELKERFNHRLNEIFMEPLQIWSTEKREVLSRISTFLQPDLEEWGLKISLETMSFIRFLPRNLYEIALQFARAEQLLLEEFTLNKESVKDNLGLTYDDMVAIQATAKQRNLGSGTGLFNVVRGMSSPARGKIADWLKQIAGAGAENLIRVLFLGKQSEQDIKLCEQIILSAFRSPILGLGEWFDPMLDASIFSHYQILQQDFDTSSQEQGIAKA